MTRTQSCADSADGICTVPTAADNTVVAVSAGHMGEGDEVLFRRAGLPGRMIPVPSQIAAGCGLAWKALPADEELLRGELAAAGVPTEGFTVIDMWEVVR